MAKVTYGLVITEARGKAGEVVYSRGRAGDYISKTPYYVQPITPDVAAVRAIMKVVGAMWYKTLTEAQRVSWRAFARGIGWKDALNQNVVPAGSDLFTQCNFNTANLGGAYILNPPLALRATDPGALTLSASASARTVTLTPTNALPAHHAPLIMATRGLNAGWQFYNKFLRQLRGSAQPIFADTFAGTAPVPPWIAAPTYLAPNWPEASNILTTTGTLPNQDIYATSPSSDYTISCQIKMTNTSLDSWSLTARLNTTNGNRYATRLYGPGPGLYIEYVTGWPDTSETILAGGSWPHNDGAWHTFTWTLKGTTQTLTNDATTIIALTDATLPTGPPGITQRGTSLQFRDYQLTTPPATPPSLPNIGPQYVAKFGTMTPGQRIGASAAYVNLLTGAKSPTQTQSCIVAA